MFAAHATEMADNPAFRLKLVLILAAVVNAAAFHRWPFRSVGRWDVAAATLGEGRGGCLAVVLDRGDRLRPAARLPL